MDKEKNDRYQVCGKHNQQQILFDPTKKENLCLVCVQEMAGLIPINQSITNYKKHFDFSNTENESNIQQYQNLLNVVQNYKQKLVADLDQIIQFISDQIKELILFKQKLQKSNELDINQFHLINELEIECLNQTTINDEVKNKLSGKLEEFKNEYSKLDDLLLGFYGKEQQIQLNQVVNQKKKYEYQLIEKSIRKEERACILFAFNQENTILVIVCQKKEQKKSQQEKDHEILVYEFKNGQIIGEAQVLNDHLGKINCLYFMKQTNSFISGSNDNSIIFWELNKTNHWIAKKQMKQNSGIMNILMNGNEDLLILNTFSEANTFNGQNNSQISFLAKASENWICQDIIEKDRNMIEMSLNSKGNKLIILGGYEFLGVFEKQKENKWVRAQKVMVNKNGYGLQFITNNKFVLLSTNVDYMEVFQFNQDLQNFKKVQQVEVQNCDQNQISFPCQFIQDLNFLTVKHGNFSICFKQIRKVIYKSFKLFNFTVIGYQEG